MARKSVIANMFGRSPVKPLQQHMAMVLECARLVPDLFQAMAEDDRERLIEIKEKIFEREEAADKLKNELRSHLPKSLFMPIDRRDLLEVLQMQDSIADTAQDIAGLLEERPMELPIALKDPLIALSVRCVDTCELSNRIINELDELLEVGFSGREVTRVEKMVAELNKLEDETDVMGLQLTRTLFEHEDEMKPVSVMMWYRLIEWVGDLADYAEKVGDRLRLLIAR
ncbi:MAG: TIGR00153 family protein [Proteobacteria bacterium]|nr:TIGR00153 family protein [Pseudomonadota bacterium]